MPGGLTSRCQPPRPDALVVSMQQGGGSKDTWVESSGPICTLSLLPSAAGPVELSRGGSDLPSRTADNLFWLGRYVDACGRVRPSTSAASSCASPNRRDWPTQRNCPSWLRASPADQTMTYPGFVGAGAEARLAAPEQELFSVIFDAFRPGSLQGHARRVAPRLPDGPRSHFSLTHGAHSAASSWANLKAVWAENEIRRRRPAEALRKQRLLSATCWRRSKPW